MVTIPNELHRKELTERITIYYKEVLLKDFVEFLPPAQLALQRVYRTALRDEQRLPEMVEKFRESMVNVLKAMPERHDIREPLPGATAEAVHPNEDLFHSIFNYISLSLRVSIKTCIHSPIYIFVCSRTWLYSGRK
jgi:hypothetical protein